MLNEYLVLKEELGSLIRQHDVTEDQFNEMALKVFRFQYEYNQPFRTFCRKRRVSPRTIKHYTDIPPVPIDGFKLMTLSAFSAEEAEAVFMTSGTTNSEKRGKNYHRDLEIYDLSMKTHFKPYVLPDMDKIKMFVLFPDEKTMPNSSLAHYLHIAKETFGTMDSMYAFDAERFDIEHLIEELKQTVKSEDPILLIGATFSFTFLLDECLKRGIRLRLPPKSRVVDTGGAKGRTREIEPETFKKEMSRLFSIPVDMCINMYGMTELSSQFYDQTLRDAYYQLDGRAEKKAPHWVRTHVFDIELLQRKPVGEKGIIVHYDLANLNSVAAILTEDTGIETGDGFYLLGRAQGAEAKGCSLAVEQFLSAAETSKENGENDGS